jgi:hypothetical protein
MLTMQGLIAMMGIIMARQSPGCAIVTDSVTSTGLSSFLQELVRSKNASMSISFFLCLIPSFCFS